MSIWSTPERVALRETAARFVAKEVEPHLAEWEEAGRVPHHLHSVASNAGLLGVGFPEDVGGCGGDTLDLITLTEAMIEAGASSGLMAALFTHGIAAPHMAATGDAHLVETYVRPTLAGEKIGALAVTEPSGGSDVAALRTTARRDGAHYVVDGSKTFITSGVRADFVTTAVRTGGSGQGGISLLVIDTDTKGLSIGPPLTKMGWRCSDTAELFFDQVRVPVSNLVGAEHGGFAQLAAQFVGERLSLAVHAYSIAARSLALAVEYARQRETFGRRLSDRQVIAHKLVDMNRRVDVSRTYTRAVAERHVAGESVVAEACLAKNTAVAECAVVVDEAVQIHGGSGYMTGSEVERHYRDARILGIGGGSTEVLTDLAARLLGYSSVRGPA